MISNDQKTDVLIIGSGAAGLYAAWHASRFGKVTLITKSGLETSSSYWAQGGIAAVLNSNDTFQSHRDDTLKAGRRLCNRRAVDILVREGAFRVQELVDMGMPFDRKNGSLDFGLEGGHSHRRVLHANGAATGKALIEFLTGLIKSRDNIEIIENAFVYELMADEGYCRGARAYLYKDQKVLTAQSRATLLATGGYSALYNRSTNPHTSTGDGLWLGFNAGAVLKDLEFIQFHPTAFYAEDGTTFLISEAVRGEGAYLYNEEGERFMADHPQQELAPRDVVSQEIFSQLKHQEQEYVFLDVRHLDYEKLRNQFPHLIRRVAKYDIDVGKEGIPVAPAAHYCIGGVAADVNGQTCLKGLYACGEVAATEVHGANRLASNSLLECLVFGKRAVDHALEHGVENNVTSSQASFEINSDLRSSFSVLKGKVAGILSRYVGIQREAAGLKKALEDLHHLQDIGISETGEYFSLRSKGILQNAELITKTALQREESRGVHARTDYPGTHLSANHFTYSKESRPLFAH